MICLQLFVVGFETFRLFFPLTSHTVHQCLHLHQLLLQHLHILHTGPLQLWHSKRDTLCKNSFDILFKLHTQRLNMQLFPARKCKCFSILDIRSWRSCISGTNSLRFGLIHLQKSSVIQVYLQSIVFMKERTNKESKWCLWTLASKKKVSTESHCVLDCTSSVWSLSFSCFSFCSCSVSLASLWSAASRRLFSSSKRDFRSVNNHTFHIFTPQQIDTWLKN